MKIKYILCIFQSRPDRTYGRSEYAFNFIATETGKSVCGKVNLQSDSNIRSGIYHLNGQEHIHNHVTTVSEMPTRQFRYMTKDWARVSDNSQEIARFMAMANEA